MNDREQTSDFELSGHVFLALILFLDPLYSLIFIHLKKENESSIQDFLHRRPVAISGQETD
jgi:hypothetical protein